MRFGDIVLGMLLITVLFSAITLYLTSNPLGEVSQLDERSQTLISSLTSEANKIQSKVIEQKETLANIQNVPLLGTLAAPVIGIFEVASFLATIFTSFPVYLDDVITGVLTYIGIPAAIIGVITGGITVWFIFKLVNILWRKEGI